MALAESQIMIDGTVHDPSKIEEDAYLFDYVPEDEKAVIGRFTVTTSEGAYEMKRVNKFYEATNMKYASTCVVLREEDGQVVRTILPSKETLYETEVDAMSVDEKTLIARINNVKIDFEATSAAVWVNDDLSIFGIQQKIGVTIKKFK